MESKNVITVIQQLPKFLQACAPSAQPGPSRLRCPLALTLWGDLLLSLEAQVLGLLLHQAFLTTPKVRLP